MSETTRIPTNLRTLLILEVLGNSGVPMTPTEINAHIGLPKQTVHRLCKTLEKEGYLTRQPGEKRLRPGRRLRALGTGMLHGQQLHIARHQILQNVASQVRETVNFVIAEEAGMRYVDRVDTDWPFRIQLPIGSNVPFHCTASGKTFMATLSRAAREKFLSSLSMKKLTPNTIVSPSRLSTELELIADRGFSIDNEEFMEGMVAIAVPVTDPNKRFVAALAFHGPTQRITIDQAIARKDILLEGAQNLKQALFA